MAAQSNEEKLHSPDLCIRTCRQLRQAKQEGAILDACKLAPTSVTYEKKLLFVMRPFANSGSQLRAPALVYKGVQRIHHEVGATSRADTPHPLEFKSNMASSQ